MTPRPGGRIGSIREAQRKPASDPTRPLKLREQLFVAAYVETLNGQTAAIRAGYSVKTARFQASDLLTRPNIAAAVEAAHLARLERLELKGDDVLRELMRIAMADISAALDADGNIKPIHEIPIDLRRAMASIEVVIRNAAAGDGHTDRVWRIKWWDKNRALETLAKHLGLLSEHIQVDADVELSWKL